MPRKRTNRNRKQSRRRSFLTPGGRFSHGAREGLPSSSAGSALSLSNMSTNILGGFPSRTRVLLAYTQFTSVSTTTRQNQVWRGNGPFDPDFTGTGSQPYDYDDWALIYNRHRTHSCRIDQQFIANVNQVFLHSVHAGNTTTGMVAQDAMAAPNSRWVCANGSTADQAGRGMISWLVSTKSVLGEGVLGPDRFQALTNTVPADPWYFNTSVTSIDGGTVTGYLVTKLTYDIEFFDRNDQALDLLRKVVRGARADAGDAKASSPDWVELASLKDVPVRPEPPSTPAPERVLESLKRPVNFGSSRRIGSLLAGGTKLGLAT